MADDVQRGSGGRRSRLLGAVVAVLALTSLACQPPSDPPPGGTGVAVAQEIDGFARPWDVQFTPNGVALVTERGGTLAAVIDGSRRSVATVPGVVARGEGGLMGLAVDPGFATNRWIYTCFSAAGDVRLVRHRVLPGYAGIAESTPIVTGISSGAGNRHHGCRPVFGPNGDIWMGTGDAAVGTNPQDPTSLAGKVLRFDRDGNPSPSNPGVVDPGTGWHPLVHTMGHRNIQGLAFRPADGAAFSVEHGTACDDEINRLVPGANYGWDPRGPGGSYDDTQPMTFTGAVESVWSSGCPTIATSGAAFLDTRWGERAGSLAVATLKGQSLHVFGIAGSKVVRNERVLGGHGRLRSVTAAPDGTLWVTTDAEPGSLLQVVPK
jgi:glucose/arabinose dehydrogenase